jgi:hypothetical protein
MTGLIEPAWPTIITSFFLLGFIVLQSILSIVSKTEGGFKGLLPAWFRSKIKKE